VTSLSVLLVLATALAVGGVVSWLVPMVPLAAAVALGAAVAPPDPVAALAAGRQAGLPAKLTTLIEGEVLLSDATALTTFQVAVAVAVGGGFSFPLALGAFALATGGGLVAGGVVAFALRWLRHWFDDPLWVNALSWHEAAAQARRDVLDAQRDELLRWRDAGRLPDTSLRILQRELDHEERLLPMPPTR
jgi:CPA1 family monovalent cation:H+ antiporter